MRSSQSITRDVAPLTTRGAVKTLDAEKRTVEVMFSTGARVLRQSWWDGPSYEELSMDAGHVRMTRLQSGTAPLLTDHRSGVDNIVGVVESARLQAGKGYATVRFPSAGVDERADQLFEKIRQGIVRSVSVGYRTYKTEKVAVEGDAKIPTFRATDWEPYELSAVALPAEVGAGFRSEGSERSTNKCVFVTRQENAVENETQNQNDVAIERERVSGIMSAVRKAKLGGELAERLIKEGVTLDKAREQILDVVAARADAQPNDTAHALEVGETSLEKYMRGAEAAIAARTGVLPTLMTVAAAVKRGDVQIPGVRQAFKNFDVNEDGGELRGLTPRELAREMLEQRGIRTAGMSGEKVVALALTHRTGGFWARDNGGQNTSSDFATVLENVLGKTLLGNYAMAPDTWRKFCGVDSVQDFRTANRYRTGSFGTLDEIKESGEYKQKQIPDGAKYTVAAQTYGNKIAISRKAIVNDDMGAIMDTMGKFGRAAGLSLEKAVYDLLSQNSGLGPTMADTNPFFHSSRANVNGTGSALGAAGLDADRVILAKQKDISNEEFLGLKPDVLLVASDLGGQARVINGSKYDPTAGTAFEKPNLVYGLFRDVVDTPRLSGTRRYLFTSPGDVAAFVVCFLNGAQAPFLDQRQGWDIDGVEMKIRLDYGVAAADPKGAVTNAGA